LEALKGDPQLGILKQLNEALTKHEEEWIEIFVNSNGIARLVDILSMK